MSWYPSDELIIRINVCDKSLSSDGYNKESSCGTIANLIFESGYTLDPTINENGGGGYGIGQWTPKENVYIQGEILGLSHDECNTLEGQIKIVGSGDITGQWMNSIGLTYPNSPRNPLTLNEFKTTTDITQATVDFMAHWERPSTTLHHVEDRIEIAKIIYPLLNGGTSKEICYIAPIQDTSLDPSSFMTEQLFGYSSSRPNNFHNGLDFGSIDHPGTNMIAVCDGMIKHIYDGTSNGLGYWYLLNNNYYNFLYWESTNSRSDIIVNEGDIVAKGQTLSYRTTDHLHLSVTKSIDYPLEKYLSDVYVEGIWINPLDVLGHCFSSGDDPSPEPEPEPENNFDLVV